MKNGFVIRRCVLQGIQVVEACSAQHFARHTHDAYGIGMIVRGAQRSWSGRGIVEAGRGQLITCNPGEVHDGAPIGDARTWKMLYLGPKVVETVVADIRDGRGGELEFVEPVIQRQRDARAFESAYRALTESISDSCAQERLILLLAGLLRQVRAPTRGAPAGLHRVKARIDDDPLSSCDLADLADEAGLSRFQVIRGFARLTGLTPHAYVVQRRLELARMMLATGTAPADAAAACGFSDQSHLHRTFVRRFGVTPGAFALAVS